MRMVVLRTAHRLFQERMRETALDLDDQSLVLLVADDDALENSLRHGFRPQLLFFAARFWAASVLVRAISRRTTRTRDVFCNWPLARWKRRLNCSFFNARISSDNWSSVMTRKSARRFLFFIGPALFYDALDKARLDRQFRGGERKRLTRYIDGHAVDLEHDAAGRDAHDPQFR